MIRRRIIRTTTTVIAPIIGIPLTRSWSETDEEDSSSLESSPVMVTNTISSSMMQVVGQSRRRQRAKSNSSSFKSVPGWMLARYLMILPVVVIIRMAWIQAILPSARRQPIHHNISIVFDHVSSSSMPPSRSLMARLYDEIILVDEHAATKAIIKGPTIAQGDGRANIISNNNNTYHDRPDYAGLKIRNKIMKQQHSFHRRIHPHDEKRYQYERETFLTYLDEIGHGGTPINTWNEFDSDSSDPCLPPPWTFDYHSSCNTVHETSRRYVDTTTDETFLGRGYYRDAFLYHHYYGETTTNSSPKYDGFVMKKLHVDRDWNQRQLFKVNYEALMMEHLASTGLVGNIYGHCGTTVLVEQGQDLSHKICMDQPGYTGNVEQHPRGYFAPDILRSLTEKSNEGFYQNNDLTPQHKLDLAIDMVKSISLLHGFPHGVVAHDDISLDQWMLGIDGRVMLNDLNSIRPLSVHIGTGQYCRFNSRSGNYKAPEYFTVPMQKLVTEQSDVWSLGLVLYSVLTGLMPYHVAKSEEQVDQQTKVGAVPLLNPMFRRHSFIEQRIAEAMDRCLIRDPKERANVFWLLDYLYETKRLVQQHQRRRQGR